MTASTDDVGARRLSPWGQFWRGLQKIDEAFAHTEADDLWDRIRSLEARVDALSRERPSTTASTVSAGAEPGPQQS